MVMVVFNRAHIPKAYRHFTVKLRKEEVGVEYFGGLVTIIFVDILKIGGVDKTIWKKKVIGQYLRKVSKLMVSL